MSDQWHELWDEESKKFRMNFPDSAGKVQNVLTTGTEIWIGQGLVDQAECSAYIWTFSDSLSELKSIGRSNLTWPASPAM